MKREYKIEAWEYAVETTARFAVKKPYAERFRYDYYSLIGTRLTTASKLVTYATYVVIFLSQLRYIIKNQLFNKWRSNPVAKYNFYLANNPSYLKTVIPVLEKLMEKGEDVALFCPVNHINELKKVLKPEIAEILFPMEAIKTEDNSFKRLLLIFYALFKSIIDSVWFIFQGKRGSIFLSVDFMRFGLSHYLFYKYWYNYFNEENRYLIAANEFQYWDSLLFLSCRKTVSQSIILAHGRETEISYPIFAKKRLTWGKADVDMMVNEWGADINEVEDVGSPYFDTIYKDIKQRQKDSKNNSREFISFFAQPYYKMTKIYISEYNEALSWFYDLAKNNSSKKFQIKLHPFDSAEYYANRTENIALSTENILKTLDNCFIMLTIDSNSMLEAAVFGIPTIQCLAPGYQYYADLSNTGISLKASSASELSELCNRLVQDPDFYKDTVKLSSIALESYFSNLGHSLEIIMNKIS